MAGLRVLVCGGRDYDDLGNVWSQLDAHHGLIGIACIIHGTADMVSRARAAGIDVVTISPSPTPRSAS